MTHFLLVQLRLKSGAENLRRYTNALPGLRDVFASQGIVLRQAVLTRVGPLHEAFHLWQVDDQGHFARAQEGIFAHPDAGRIAAELGTVVESEQTRFVESVPLPLPE